MRRALYAIAAATLACASQQRTDDAARASSTTAAGTSAGAIQPSSLSPEQVRLVQRSLADRGFAVDLSGKYDTSTQRAVSDFQRARGLNASGSLDTPTVEALGLDPRDVMPVRGEGASSAATTSPTSRDPNSQGSLNAPAPSSTGGVGTNDSAPTAPTPGRDAQQGGTGSGYDSATHHRQSGHDSDVNPEGTLRPPDPGGSSTSGTGTNTGGPTAPTPQPSR